MKHGDFPDNGFTPTPEDEEAAERFYKLAERYPTFILVMRVLHSHRRLQSAQATEGMPEMILESEKRMREEALDRLCMAIPYDECNGVFRFADILETFAAELARPYKTDDPDA